MIPELPTRTDFGPDANEENWLWERFGGKTVDEAYAVFRKAPYECGEYFQWMGERAFRYYFAVIDRYLRSGGGAGSKVEGGDHLGFVLHSQLDSTKDLSGLHAPVAVLCDYVQGHLEHFETSPEKQQKVAKRWADVRQVIEDDLQGVRGPQEKPGLPTQADFGRGPDAEWAWETFGGKTLDEVYEKLSGYPGSAAENFMWTHERAFHFYFPALDRYMRSLAPMGEFGFIWVTPLMIGMHFDCQEDMSGLHKPILALCDYVNEHLDHFAREPEEQKTAAEEWVALREQIEDDARGIQKPRDYDERRTTNPE